MNVKLSQSNDSRKYLYNSPVDMTDILFNYYSDFGGLHDYVSDNEGVTHLNCFDTSDYESEIFHIVYSDVCTSLEKTMLGSEIFHATIDHNVDWKKLSQMLFEEYFGFFVCQ